MKIILHPGRKFNRLTIIELYSSIKGIQKYRCKCDCGTERIVEKHSLLKGNTQSCGCLRMERLLAKNIKHGHALSGGLRTSEYMCYHKIKFRCYNKTDKDYKHYGGRGIVMCERWLQSFENFLADIGAKPTSKHSIDRIDVNGNYEPNNCRWATQKEQTRNKRNNVLLTLNGEEKCMAEWAEYFNISFFKLRNHIKQGKSMEWVRDKFNKKPG